MNHAPRDAVDLLSELLGERRWSQLDLAEVIGRPPQFVSEVLSRKKEITRESALQFGAAFNLAPDHLLQAQDAYKLWQLGQSDSHQARLTLIRDRAKRADQKVKEKLAQPKPVYSVEWDPKRRKHVATVDTWPGVEGVSRGSEATAIRNLKSEIAKAKRAAQ